MNAIRIYFMPCLVWVLNMSYTIFTYSILYDDGMVNTFWESLNVHLNNKKEKLKSISYNKSQPLGH